eukprot:6236542-Amphidinium_carterae.2
MLLFALAQDATTRARWSVARLREIAGQPEGWATEAQIESICVALWLRLIFVPVELEDASLSLRYDLQQIFGNACHPRLFMLYWTRQNRGVHFDALLEVDHISNLSYHDLQHLGGARLREEFGCGLSTTGYTRLALPEHALATLKDAPTLPHVTSACSGAASSDGFVQSIRSARRRSRAQGSILECLFHQIPIRRTYSLARVAIFPCPLSVGARSTSCA